MFLSYSASVVLVSLALYGLWYVAKDMWNWVTTLEFVRLPDVSFVILVHNLEYEVEDLMRYLASELADSSHEYDAVVVDCGSSDLTPTILKRLAGELPGLTIVQGARSVRPLGEALPLCRGAVVHVLDLTGRLKAEQFRAVVSSLLRKNEREVAVRS